MSQGRPVPGALLVPSRCWVTPEVEALLAAMAVPAGPCSEGPVAGTGGLCSPLSCLGWGQVLSWGQRSRSLGELGTVSVQNKPLLLVCAAVASGPLPCRPWEAAEPAPSGILDAAFCIAAVLEVGGGRLCSSLCQSGVVGSTAATGGSGQECSGVLQQESMESGADLLLCALQGLRSLVKVPQGPPYRSTCPSLGPGACCQVTLLYCMAKQ